MSTPKTQQPKKQEPKLHYIQKVIGNDTYLVLANSATHPEDEFANLYYTANNKNGVALMPPFEPKMLAGLVTKNNILSQCVEAMEVNIDGTGHEFVPVEEGKDPDEKEVQLLTDFFNEPYPGISFLAQRRKLRRDLESIGYAALEVLRTVDETLQCVRNFDSMCTRFLKLDDPVLVPKTVTRGGKEITLHVWERERRYMQRVGNKYFYYREYGTSRHCHRDTGVWETETNKIDPKDRATELIMFEVNPDNTGPYGVPRWINNLPSVIGSRKAEEANLEYFDAGGLPPAIIFVQGGTLAGGASQELKSYLSGNSNKRNRAVVVDAVSSSGSLESAGSVQVKVERFGAEKANDSMYQTYDKNAEEHTRVAFRLPPLFLGKAADYNYATAVVAYMVAEEQVFQPERIEFDEKINKTILKELNVKTVKFKSKPITLKNVDAMLKAMELLKDKVSGESLVSEVNSMAGTKLEYEEPPQPGPGQMFHPQTGDIVPQPQKPQQGQDQNDANSMAEPANAMIQAPSIGVAKSAVKVVELAHKYAQSKGLIASKAELNSEDRAKLATDIAALSGPDHHAFCSIIAGYAFKDPSESLVELTSCAHG